MAKAITEKSKDCSHPILVGIGGPGGSGKSTLCKWLCRELKGAGLIHLDDYRRPRSEREGPEILGSHPKGNDADRIQADLVRARNGDFINHPFYDSKTGKICRSYRIGPSAIWICDGEVATHKAFRSEFHMMILVESHWRTQLDTRISRDFSNGNQSLEKVIKVFLQSNLQDYPKFSAGVETCADLIVYRNSREVYTVKKRLPHRAVTKH